MLIWTRPFFTPSYNFVLIIDLPALLDISAEVNFEEKCVILQQALVDRKHRRYDIANILWKNDCLGKQQPYLPLRFFFEVWTLLAIFYFFPLSWILIPLLNLQVSNPVKLLVSVFILENVSVGRQMQCYQCSGSCSLTYFIGKFHRPILY